MSNPDAGAPDIDPGLDLGPGGDTGVMPGEDMGMNEIDAGPKTPCMTDPECGTPPDNICVSGFCELGCGEPMGIQCEDGAMCDPATGHCVGFPPSCNVDDDCLPGAPVRLCQNSACVYGCTVPRGTCPGNQTCDPMTGQCSAPPTCNLDADCGSAELICESNVCVARCDAPMGTPCVGLNICNPDDGRCLPGALATGDECSINAQCTSLLCLGAAPSFCSATCSSTSDCPSDMSCFDVDGIGFCVPLDPAITPVPTGGMCTETVNNCQSLVCDINNMTCIERCSRPSDCAGFGDNCWLWDNMGDFAQICVAPGGNGTGAVCSANGDCVSGICNRYEGICNSPCCSDSDCPPAQSCRIYDVNATTPVRSCWARNPMAGALAIGASCTQDLDCETEVCVAVNPTQPQGAKVCSTLCCEDTDCTDFASGGRCWPHPGVLMNTNVGKCLPL